MSWADCFAAVPDVSVDEIREALAARRAAGDAGSDADEGAVREPAEPSPTRIVADADVLAADVCLDGEARGALEPVYRHSWTTLVASDPLIEDAAAVIESVADRSLAADWRDCIDDWREPVDQPAGDHPAVASAYRGGAMHLLSFDEELTASGTGVALHERFPVSIRQPDAFTLLFDPESLYASERTDAYPGPDRGPRGST
ncbi:DUF7384 family protein [Halohasta salina]|uniref:DUF7384 family protein n=1 Tax=Halohasta salina TaxID=2961621 RepID=UPI0020A5129F|nr:hypothetical protein [Halohasta salina]